DGVSEAIGHAACLLAYSSGAHAIICCTKTGRTAQLVAKHRSQTPIIAVSPSLSVVRRLMLTWGVFPQLSDEFETTGSMVSMALELARQSGMVARGSRVVVTGGAADAEPGQTDFLRVASIS
ncbi:MAG: pyruvate kinase, partial [Deltaproteobacteria bacterium]|nr:pyruvate kinase [Deltaproteobacteria bacterium]